MACSEFPREVRLTSGQQKCYFKTGFHRQKTMLVYEYTYTDVGITHKGPPGKVTQSKKLHAEEIMIGRLSAYTGRIKSLTMWINNSPCGDLTHHKWHNCAQQLVELIDGNPGVKLTIHCIYQYGIGYEGGTVASEAGLLKLMRKGATITSFPQADRDYILDKAFDDGQEKEKWRKVMDRYAKRFENRRNELRAQIEETEVHMEMRPHWNDDEKEEDEYEEDFKKEAENKVHKLEFECTRRTSKK